MKKEFKIGDKVTMSKIFSEEEVKAYGLVSDDSNSIHYDKEYAAKTRFGRPIVQGLLASSLFGGLLGTYMFGDGAIHLSQTVKFIKPVYVGELVFAHVVISDIYDNGVYELSCILYNNKKETAIDGKAMIMYKEN